MDKGSQPLSKHSAMAMQTKWMLQIWMMLLSWFRLASGDDCVIPDSLVTLSPWEREISMNRVVVGGYVTFANDSMEEEIYTGFGGQITRKCYEDKGDGTYLFTIEDAMSGTAQYQCLKFVHRSSIVVQVWTSNIDTDRTALCDVSNLKVDPWLMVSSWLTSEEISFHDCGFQGGYDFHTYVNRYMSSYCENDVVKPRLEVGCSDKTTISLDFRQFLCIGNLDMESVQELKCLSSWVQDNYTFTVVKNEQYVWPKTWLLRLPANIPDTGNFDIVLLDELKLELSSDLSGQYDYHKFVTSQRVFLSTCQDEAQYCETCNSDSSFKYYCLKTCGVCDPDLDDCVFSAEVQGDWMELKNFSSRQRITITITNSIIYPDSAPPLQYIALQGNQELHNRQALVSFFKNGCVPRYLCSELIHRGENILETRFSTMLTWPDGMESRAQEICREEMFGYDFVQMYEYQSQKSKLLVRHVSQSKERETVTCGIYGQLNFRSSTNSSYNCSGVLQSCDYVDLFRVEHSENCPDMPRMTQHCIGAYRVNRTHFVVTENDDDKERVHCWAFHQAESSQSVVLYKLNPVDCTNGGLDAVINANDTSLYFAKLQLETNLDGLTNEATCYRPTSTSTAMVTTTSTSNGMKKTTAAIITEDAEASTDASSKSTEETTLKTTKEPAREVGKSTSGATGPRALGLILAICALLTFVI